MAFIAKSAAWADVESQIQPPHKIHQSHRQEVDRSHADMIRSIPNQDRPDAPTDTLWSRTKNSLLSTNRNQRTKIELADLAVTKVHDADELEKAWILEAKTRKLETGIQKTFLLALRRAPGPSETLEHAGQILYLCIDRPSRGQYVVCVPCRRPTKYRTSIERKQVRKNGYNAADFQKESAYESDCHVVERIRETIENELGAWVRFVPYFGIIAAEIVEVS